MAAEEDNISKARRLWQEAREIAHGYVPDWENDGEYLSKVCEAARLGSLEAMVKLGEYAYRRKAIVEAYYWTALAEMKGAKRLGGTLRDMRARWMANGYSNESGNVHDGFSGMQASIARAMLGILCSVDAPNARLAMREMAESGVEEAQLFLKSRVGGSR